MVHTEIWEKFVPEQRCYLCFECLQKRVGRKLTKNDFTYHAGLGVYIFWWEDYDNQKHKAIDKWQSTDIEKHAMFGEKLSAQARWYQANKLGKDADFIKAVSRSDQIVAFLILNLSDGEVGINPIVVNPKLVGKGLGKEIIKDLIANCETILGHKVHIFTANISLKNTKSIRFFEALGFRFDKLNDSKDFASYVKVSATRASSCVQSEFMVE